MKRGLLLSVLILALVAGIWQYRATQQAEMQLFDLERAAERMAISTENTHAVVDSPDLLSPQEEEHILQLKRQFTLNTLPDGSFEYIHNLWKAPMLANALVSAGVTPTGQLVLKGRYKNHDPLYFEQMAFRIGKTVYDSSFVPSFLTTDDIGLPGRISVEEVVFAQPKDGALLVALAQTPVKQAISFSMLGKYGSHQALLTEAEKVAIRQTVELSQFLNRKQF